MFHIHAFRTSIRTLSALGLLTTLVGAVPASVSAQQYKATNLSLLPNFIDDFPVGINNLGQVVGYGDTLDYDQHAVLWQNNVMTDLGTLPGGTFSYAIAINNAGQVVGYSDTGQTDKNGVSITHAVLWQNGTITDLGVLGGSNSQAYGINDAGQIVGYSDTGQTDQNGYPISHAVLWQNGTIADLGTLPGGGFSYATAINNTGQAVGFADGLVNGHFVYDAVLWQNGSASDLGTLPNTDQSVAYAINDAGQIVGDALEFGYIPHAFIWQNGVITHLKVLHGDTYNDAYGINGSGQAVGDSITGGGGDDIRTPSKNGVTAVLYSNGKTYDLNRMISFNTGIYLWSATAINDPGQIVGVDENGNGFLLTPIQVTLSLLTLTPSTVHGGTTATGRVALNGSAPDGGAVVTLSSSNPAASVPASVTVPKGATVVTFQITTTSVTRTTKGNITASYNDITKSKSFTVKP